MSLLVSRTVSVQYLTCKIIGDITSDYLLTVSLKGQAGVGRSQLWGVHLSRGGVQGAYGFHCCFKGMYLSDKIKLLLFIYFVRVDKMPRPFKAIILLFN